MLSHSSNERIPTAVIAVLLTATLLVAALASEDRAIASCRPNPEDPVEALQSVGLVRGTPGGFLEPERAITRVELVVLAVRATGKEDSLQLVGDSPIPWKDATTHWAKDYLAMAHSSGLVVGYPDGTVRPDVPATYAEVVTMGARILGVKPLLNENWPHNYLLGLQTAGAAVNLPSAPDWNMPAPRREAFGILDTLFRTVVGHGEETWYERWGCE